MTMRILVTQHGARRYYAVPRMLEQAGVLEALYTDSTVYSRLGRMARWLHPRPGGRMARLVNRVPHGVSRDKVFSTDAVFWFEMTRARRGRTAVEDYEYAHWCTVLSRRMAAWGVRKADTLYNMYCENLVFVEQAKAQGLRIMTDVYMNPQTRRIVAEECRRFPRWAEVFQARRGIDAVPQVCIEKMLALSDVLICPSQWVIDGLSDYPAFDPAKVALVPNACSLDYGGRRNCPIRGRVLFAGVDALGKGLPYLGQAAIQLRARGRDYEFRVAGVEDRRVWRDALCRELHFLGRLPLPEMKEEFLTADIFVLPTLSEGFAGVCMQAMAAGLPVVTTRCAGTQIRSGVDGVIVPERDATALAEAIDACIQRRSFRQDLAEHAFLSSGYFSEGKWWERPQGALQKVGAWS
jgi:glycosyltransferase involved in cell wall biosynthesis